MNKTEITKIGHSLCIGPVPIHPRTGAGPRPGGLGPLTQVTYCKSQPFKFVGRISKALQLLLTRFCCICTTTTTTTTNTTILSYLNLFKTGNTPQYLAANILC